MDETETETETVTPGSEEVSRMYATMMAGLFGKPAPMQRVVVLDGPDHILLVEDGVVTGTFKRIRGRGERGKNDSE